jgi:two-component system, OmpR family, phosphate regulon sensor histidine kinase PhoR
MSSSEKPHLVLRFAVASLIAIVLVGAAGVVLMTGYARDRAESDGEAHALFVVSSVLAPALEGVDLSEPLQGATYERVRELVAERVLFDGRAVRVKIWRSDGTIVFSDEPRLVGMKFPDEVHELDEVMSGEADSGISDLEDEENTLERDLADKLFFTYAPLRLQSGGPVVGVAELYQDYAFIQSNVDAVLSRMAIMFGVGLAVLYTLLLPIAHRASRDLRRQNERLNELLENEQRTVAELRDLNQKMDDFVAAASHELRTPLTSIIGYLATLRHPDLGSDPTVRAEFLEAADAQTKRLLRLITNLLSAAQMEEGARSVIIERVDLAAIARAVVAELVGASERVRIVTPPDQAVPTDRARVTEVLTNLIDNALKYSSPDTTVEVGASVDADGFRLWVSDHGVGIVESEQATIFERFHQVDQSATRRFGGVGLGLFLSKGLVQELDGTIEVTSSPGSGSTFTVVLPMGGMPRDSREQVSASTG